MKCKVFVSSTTAAMLGTKVSGASAQPAGGGALSVRSTIGGPLVTPKDTFFVYSQMRTPAQHDVNVQIDGLVEHATRYSASDLQTCRTSSISGRLSVSSTQRGAVDLHDGRLLQ
jgi:DMSO/TMAO reductase YedYZ molybdopterin-dependent catalytic subunit